jgi:multidrug resistance efflux pump
MSLDTEQRDADGNILLDGEGKPIMIPVRHGLQVFKDQVLGNFDDRELYSVLEINQAQLEVAKAEREKDTEKVFAARSLQVAMLDVKRMTDGNRRNAGTFAQADIDRAILVQCQAEANLDLQKYTLEEIKTREVSVREAELNRTKIQIENQKLVAPIDGMIVSIGAAVGELKREGEPILEIVQLNTLHVVVQVNVKDYHPNDLSGKQAVIHVLFPNGRTETFQGEVIFCDPRVKVDTFEALIEVQNRRVGNHWLLQPGYDNVEVVIPL